MAPAHYDDLAMIGYGQVRIRVRYERRERWENFCFASRFSAAIGPTELCIEERIDRGLVGFCQCANKFLVFSGGPRFRACGGVCQENGRPESKKENNAKAKTNARSHQ
jgi:hypothetical protein